MRWFRLLFFRFQPFFSRKKIEAEMSEEIRLHLEMATEAHLAAGMSLVEAQVAARREFGGVEQAKEAYRDERGLRWLEDCLRDVRHSVRSLLRDKGFIVTVLLIFALCLAANVAIFSVVDSVLLRPLPFREPDRLVTVYDSYPQAGLARGGVSPLHYLERHAQITAFEDTAAWIHSTETLGGADAPESFDLIEATPSFFRLLGVRVALGRTFTDEDAAEGITHVVVLSDEVWRRRFNADPAIVGRMISVSAILCTVVGVMPPGFMYLSQPAKLWMPLRFAAYDLRVDQRYRTGMEMIARLRPGVTSAQAQAEADALNARPVEGDILATLAHKMGFHTIIHDLHSDHVAELRPVLLLLQAGVLFLLVIGAVNLANLVLVRTTGRAKEFSVRRALGASRFRLARALIVETLLLAIVGGLLGLGLGAAALRGITILAADRLPIDLAPGLDVTTCLVAAGVSFFIGLLLAVPAAWQTLHGKLTVALSLESRGGTATPAVHRLRHALIVAQIALAFGLLTGAGLLGLSFARVLAVNPGFRPDNVLTGTVALPWSNYQEPQQRVVFVERLLTALRALPGVTSAGISTRVPFSGSDKDDFSPIMIEGRALTPDESAAVQYYRGVGGDYLAALRAPLLKGRFLTDDDAQPGNKRCVIDDAIARRFWPEGDALGRRLTFGVAAPKTDDYFTIVGIVGSVKQNNLAERHGYGVVYYPNALFPALGFTVALRTAQAPEGAGSALRAAVQRIDPELPLVDLKTMATRVNDSLVGRRIPFVLAGIFAGVALVLAAVGIYGVLAYSVVQRRREIGIRIALGAQPEQILGQFLGLGMRLLAIGLPLGLFGAWLVGRAMAGLLFGIGPANPVVLSGTAVVLATAAMLACVLPARRAARVDPMVALRAE